jgi:NADH:ubiquinone oxidoreductase subunit 3 (subunit A)
MNTNFLLTPPVAFGLFLLIVFLVYRFFRKRTPKGKDHTGKYLPYSGGQNLPPVEVRLSYQEYFRLGLLFGLIHVSTLVVSLLPLQVESHKIGLFYLAALSVSAFVLVRGRINKNWK